MRARAPQPSKTAGGQASFSFAATAQAKPVPGVGNSTVGVAGLPQDQKAQRIAESREASRGTLSYALGPIAGNISTNPNRGLTPQKISDIQGSVRTSGLMLRWAELIEDVFHTDSQIAQADKAGREAVTGAPFSVEPAPAANEKEAEAALAIADYQMAVFDGISEWNRASERCLSGNAAGYSLEEAIYDERTITVPFGNSYLTVTGETPVDFETVHLKHTRWDFSQQYGTRLMLDTGMGGFIAPPEHKFMYYRASSDYAVRLRGYMWPAIWLHLLLGQAWARWGVILQIWGIRAPYGVASIEQWQDPVRRAEMIQQLVDYGEGRAALFTDDFQIEASPGITDGDSRGMHAALITACSLQISKLILGSTLTSEISGTGSYNAADTHADSKQNRVIGWERNLSGDVRAWMRHALRRACYLINPDGSFGEVNPRGLSAQLGMPPERVVALCGRPTWRISREMTPDARMKLYTSAVNELGLDLDDSAPYREFGLARARHASKRIKGAAVVLSPDAAVVSTADAGSGAKNEPTPTETDSGPALPKDS